MSGPRGVGADAWWLAYPLRFDTAHPMGTGVLSWRPSSCLFKFRPRADRSLHSDKPCAIVYGALGLLLRRALARARRWHHHRPWLRPIPSLCCRESPTRSIPSYRAARRMRSTLLRRDGAAIAVALAVGLGIYSKTPAANHPILNS